MSLFDDWSTDELKGFRKSLARAAVSGQLMVRFADRQVQYQDMDALMRAASLIDAEIQGRAGAAVTRAVQVNTSKGF